MLEITNKKMIKWLKKANPPNRNKFLIAYKNSQFFIVHKIKNKYFIEV